MPRLEAFRRSRGATLVLLVASVLFIHSAPSAPDAPIFDDVTKRSLVRFHNEAPHTSRKYLLETMTGGAAMLDYDGDGRLDLFFVNGAALSDPMPKGSLPDKSGASFWNRLYRNLGDGTFSDVTEKAGVRGRGFDMGVAVGDYNNDGFPDLYVTGYGSNILYRNNGDGTFTDVTSKAHVAGSGWSTGAAFVDYDRDGLLDLIVSRYAVWDFSFDIWCGPHEPGRRAYCHPDRFHETTHLLFHNNGDGTFTDVSATSGIAGSPGKGLGVAINDFDRDGWPDIVIANDSVAEQLFRNQRDGTFREVGLAQGMAYDEDGHAFAGMGADFSDYDNDGWPDIVINALASQRYALFHNNRGTLEYASAASGIGAASFTHSGWGLKFVDYDNDGWKDLFVGQGHVLDTIEQTQPNLRYNEPFLLMRNRKDHFEDATRLGGPALLVPRAARGVAFGDLDNDGRIDIAVNCNNQDAVLLHNQDRSGNHWLLVNTIGSKSNRDGIGASLRLVSSGGAVQYGFVSTASSYLSASDKRVHFGLGRDRSVKLLEITWPSGVVQRLENISADRILTAREP